MKRNLVLLLAAGLVASPLAVCAQDNQPVSEGTNASPVASEGAAAAQPTAIPAATEVEPAAAPAAETPIEISAAPSADSQAKTSAVIPLIVMDEVPLTDAIKNLARQANINYLLDPRLSFGQAGADGRPVPQPNVSIRWENISAEQALHALLNNYTLQMVDDPKTKIARITVKDPAAPDPLLTQIIQLKYSSPTNILPAVQSGLIDKRSRVMPDVRTSQLVLVATENEIRAITNMVSQLDLPTRQVLIEARLLETSLNPRTIKGLDWTGTLQAQNLRFGNNLNTPEGQQPPSGSANPTLSSSFPKMLIDTAGGFSPATAFLDADGVSAVFSMLNQSSEARVLSTPRTVTLDNEAATLSVTRQFPIFSTTAGTANTPGGSSVTYSNLGVILNVTPRISANDNINLRVVPEVSRIFDTVTVFSQGQENTAYIFDSRRMETTVMIPSGNTLVLGGLVQDDTRNSNTKVPMLGDIPVLGRAFRSDSKSQEKNNLLIFITPTIVKDTDYQPTKTEFLQTPVQDAPSKTWTSWDSAKPKDWSRRKKAKAEPQFAEVQ